MFELVFSFDNTGSMHQAINVVKKNVSETIQKMFSTLPDFRAGVIVHNDYEDAKPGYMVHQGVNHHYPATYDLKSIKLTTNQSSLVRFIKEAEKGFGYDSAEMYEMVLHEARHFNWTPSATKSLVIIGDENPHTQYDSVNKLHLDWRVELKELLKQGIKVYAVHALASQRPHARPFYEEIANTTGGFYLTLEQFYNCTDLLLAIAISHNDPAALQQFQENLVKEGRFNRSMNDNIAKLAGTYEKRETDVWGAQTVARFNGVALAPVPPARFQEFVVPSDQRIDDFVSANGFDFHLGHGFYELVKQEIISANKEIVIRDKRTGDTYTGTNARNLAGLPHTEAKLKVAELQRVLQSNYTVFVQSTSNNRKLVAGQRFLYEVDNSSVPVAIPA